MNLHVYTFMNLFLQIFSIISPKHIFFPSKISVTKLDFSNICPKELNKRIFKKLEQHYWLTPLLSPKGTIQTFLMTLFFFGLISDSKVWVSGIFLKHKTVFKSPGQNRSMLQGKAVRTQLKDDVWICRDYGDFLYQS